MSLTKHAVLVGWMLACASLFMPVSTVLGDPVAGWTFLAASMVSVAGPFKEWRDVYISLSAPANVGLYLLAPWFIVKGCRSRTTAGVISSTQSPRVLQVALKMSF